METGYEKCDGQDKETTVRYPSITRGPHETTWGMFKAGREGGPSFTE